MPKAKIIAPMETPYTDERLGIPSGMVDTDNMDYGTEARFAAGASLQEGVSGAKSIDTEYENFSEDTVDAPRSTRQDVPIGYSGLTPDHEGVDNPAPVQVNKSDYPHRGY